MAYNNNTPGIYKIPYWARGERAAEQSNLRISQIIENQLTGDSKLFGANGVLQEGTYTGIFISGSSIVTLSATATSPALEALIASKYVNQSTTLQWTGLPNNSTIYLYAQTIEQNIYLNGQLSTLQDKVCVAVWNTSGSTPTQSLLLAKVTTTTSGITVDSSASITDNGDYSTGKIILVTFQQHRTLIPIDHPDLSISQAKLMTGSVLSRTIAPWDGISTANQVLSGAGIATGHLKDGAVTSSKTDFRSGLNLTTLTVNSGLDVYGGALLRNTLTVQGNINLQGPIVSGLNIYGNSLLRGSLNVQSGVTTSSLLVNGPSKFVSGLEVINQALFRGNVIIQGILVASGLTTGGGGGTTITGGTRLTNVIIANDTTYSGTSAFADAYNAVRQIATSDRPIPILVGFGTFSGVEMNTSQGGGTLWNPNVSIIGLSTSNSVVQTLITNGFDMYLKAQNLTINEILTRQPNTVGDGGLINLDGTDIVVNSIDASSTISDGVGGPVVITGNDITIDSLSTKFFLQQPATGGSGAGGDVTFTGNDITIGLADLSGFSDGIDSGFGPDEAFGGTLRSTATDLQITALTTASVANGTLGGGGFIYIYGIGNKVSTVDLSSDSGNPGAMFISNIEIDYITMGTNPNVIYARKSKFGPIGLFGNSTQHTIDQLGSSSVLSDCEFVAKGPFDCIHNLVGNDSQFTNVLMVSNNGHSIGSNSPATIRCYNFTHSGGFTSGVTVTDGSDNFVSILNLYP